MVPVEAMNRPNEWKPMNGLNDQPMEAINGESGMAFSVLFPAYSGNILDFQGAGVSLRLSGAARGPPEGTRDLREPDLRHSLAP